MLLRLMTGQTMLFAKASSWALMLQCEGDYSATVECPYWRSVFVQRKHSRIIGTNRGKNMNNIMLMNHYHSVHMMNLNTWSLCILHACETFNAVSMFTVVLESSSKSRLINCNKYTMFMCTHNIKYYLLGMKNIEKLGIPVKKFIRLVKCLS